MNGEAAAKTGDAASAATRQSASGTPETSIGGQARHEASSAAPVQEDLPAKTASEHNDTTRSEGQAEGDEAPSPTLSKSSRRSSNPLRHVSHGSETFGVSEWSHQQLAPHEEEEQKEKDPLGGWQQMPSYAEWDMFDDDGRQIAKAHQDSDSEDAAYGGLGGAGKGYTKVQLDEDAKSTTSLDDNTAYLFKEKGTEAVEDEDDEEARDPMQQMQATKELLNDNQKIAYVGLVRLAMADMLKSLEAIERTRGDRKQLDLALEAFMMWTQKMMLRLYGHMELDSAEQVMIEQLSEHGLQPGDLTPSLMENARVKNPMQNEDPSSQSLPTDEDAHKSDQPRSNHEAAPVTRTADTESIKPPPSISEELAPPEYNEHEDADVRLPSDMPTSEKIEIDLRWTVLCDLFLVLIADSMYDARSRTLLETVGGYLKVEAVEICRFERRVTEALEMQEAKEKEKWNEEEHIQSRQKLAKRKRLMMMGLATAGGTLVIGLSGGILGPVIGAGLAAGFTAVGVTGTGTFLGGAAAAGIIGAGSAVAGGAMGAKAGYRRTGAVSTFEYRPLYNNKRVNLIVTVAGWLNGKVDDPRLPFSTIDPVMGDVYSVWWEPEMLTSMGQTLAILATEALTQALQQVLAWTFLTALMSALQAPILLAKLTYLIDNPWSVSLARADRAGLILADSLVDRNLGARPITLVGFSIGSRVIFSALQELSKRGAVGLVQNVYLFGSPIIAKKDDYLKAKTVVSGRFVNAYSTTDWILGYLFRATGGGVMRIAGLASVDFTGIENFDVTKFVNGHMAYRAAMPKLLREVGFAITSDEFSEIEDPDPDNHQARQRQLIDEIEEARKDIHANQEKKGWGWFKRKKAAEKKSWEIYDDQSQKDRKGDPNGVLFDVEAIRKEVVEISAQGLEVKQLESTMPTLKIEDQSSSNTLHRPVENLRGTKSDVALPLARSSIEQSVNNKWSYDRDEYEHASHDGEISMSFEPAEPRPVASRAHSALDVSTKQVNGHSSPAHDSHSTAKQPVAASAPAPAAAAEQNVWDYDDDDEFKEKEVEMSFA